MRRSIRFLPLARQDLREIWTYTMQRWGSAQVEDYLDLIEAEVVALAHDPALGSRQDALAPGLRKKAVGSHRIYYRSTESEVQIVRILHERRDAALALGSQDQ